MTEHVPIAIGIDVGGSGIKGAAVDLTTGRLASSRHRILTPQPSTPQACLEVIARIVRAIVRELPAAATAPVGVGVPSVVIDGVTRTAANIDPAWIGFDGEAGLDRILGRSVRLVNDADAAGLAEMRFGAGRGRSGTVLVLTLGTGLGSGFFVDGRLVPNTELGHMEIRGRDAERRSAAAARVRRGLSWKAWAEDLDEHLNAIHRLFWPSLLILGGGVSKNADKFIPRLTVPTAVVPAILRNEAGIVGAALFAAETAHAEGLAIPVAVPEKGSEAAAAEAEPEGAEDVAEPEAPEAAEAEPAEAAEAEGAADAAAAALAAEPGEDAAHEAGSMAVTTEAEAEAAELAADVAIEAAELAVEAAAEAEVEAAERAAEVAIEAAELAVEAAAEAEGEAEAEVEVEVATDEETSILVDTDPTDEAEPVEPGPGAESEDGSAESSEPTRHDGDERLGRGWPLEHPQA